MKNKFKICSISAALVLSMMLTGCSENTQPNTSGNSSPSSQSEASNSSAESSKPEDSSDTESSVEAEALSINSDVVWGLGKTLDELSGKYGKITGDGEISSEYVFENGYGIYRMENGVCKSIDAIKANDILTGTFSTLNYEELASRAGITYWHVDGDEPTPLDNCWWAYFTHPDYSRVTFGVYSSTKRDEIKADKPGVMIWQGDPETLIGPSDYNG